MSSVEQITDQPKSGATQIEVLHSLDEADDHQGSIWKLLVKHWRIVIFALFANCGSLLFGYDILIQGAITALPAFSIHFGSPFGETMILPALWQGLWQAFSSMGIMVGASGNGLLQDRFGRKYMFSVAGVIAAIATAIAFVSGDLATIGLRRGLLLLSKFILGTSMGIAMSTCQTYVAEISPARLRTVLLGLFPFLIVVAQMVAISIIFKRVTDMSSMAFKIPFASQWAFSGYAVIATLVVPETPVHLVAKNREVQAQASLKRLYASDTEVAQQLQAIKTTVEQEKISGLTSEAATYQDCFKGSNVRRSRIIALLNSLQQLMGVTLVANGTYFFIMAGMTPSKSLKMNQIGVGLSMFGTLVSWVVMNKLGRRTAILGGFVAAGVLFLAMGIAGFFPNNSQALTFVAVSLLLAAVASNVTVASAYPVAAAEIPCARLRAKSLGVGFFVNAFMSWLFALTVPYMFNADEGNLGGKIGFVFMGTCVIGFVLSWFEIPETKNISYAHIDYLFEKGTKTRDFKATASSTGEFIGSDTFGKDAEH